MQTTSLSHTDTPPRHHIHIYILVHQVLRAAGTDVRIDPVTTTKKEPTTASYSQRRTTKENKATVAFRSVCCHITYCRLRSLAEFTIYGVCFQANWNILYAYQPSIEPSYRSIHACCMCKHFMLKTTRQYCQSVCPSARPSVRPSIFLSDTV